MQSRRDQVQAHMFVMGRLSTGLFRDDPDAADPPHRRTTKGVVIGLVIGALVALVVTVYGVIVPGGADNWKKPGTLVVDEDTGARYISLDGVLHPVLNQTSAKLLAGDRMRLETLSSASIAKAPRGSTVGIVGAPDALPRPGALTRDPWSACAVLPPRKGSDPVPDAASSRLVLGVGLPVQGRPVTSDRATLVRAATGHDTYLLWHGTRMRLNTDHAAAQALGYGDTAAYPVPDGFLNALPAGPDIASPDVPDLGAKGPELAGRPTKVGQLFGAADGRRFLLRKEGLTPVTGLEFALLKGDPRTQHTAYDGGAVDVRQVGPDDLERHRAPAAPPLVGGAGGGVPGSPPKAMPVKLGEAVCAVTESGDRAPSVSVVLPQASAIDGHPPSREPGLTADSRTADGVAVRPGKGALAVSLSSSGAGGTYYLVTESGAKYPLVGADGPQQLGYDPAHAVRMPSALLGMLATGPTLDAKALQSRGLVQPPSGPKGRAASGS
ncbi:type VII secretion protein EccB [Streptomyces varsoviensis]|uniref:type VII secretion protein EccB n=1 Tax=Streptomyces varsoviensis TaxID=67373 RepID=UPI0033E346EC